MNSKATQWLKLAQWLQHRQLKLQRAGNLVASAVTQQNPDIKDPEIEVFIRDRQVMVADVHQCLSLEIEATYQAVLCAPESEAEIVETLGYRSDRTRLDALYAHAAKYTQWVEDEAQRESAIIRRTGRKGRWIQIIALATMLVCLVIGGWVYFTYRAIQRYIEQPAGIQKGQVKFVVPKGASADIVAQRLHEAGVITQRERFYNFVRYHHHLRSIFTQLRDIGSVQLRAGDYTMSTHLTPQQILALLNKGPQRESIRVTVPDGFDIWKIAARLEGFGICRKDDFLRLVQDPDYTRRMLGWDAPRLEGYLYPDTYRFYPNTPPHQVIQQMVGRFKQIFTPEFKRRAEEMNWSVHKVMTLASIIEKETGLARERPTISSVFHNRLRRGWKLETDPTVIYGLFPNFSGRLTQKDLHNPHEYNTYQHHGMPPSPIASAGVASIRAALYPPKTQYMFFVSKNDGSHIFSRTGKEHRKWVEIYQIRRTAPPKTPPEK